MSKRARDASRPQAARAPDADEERLREQLFGGDILDVLPSAPPPPPPPAPRARAAGGGAGGGVGGGGGARARRGGGAAWEDPDDAAVRVDLSGTSRLRKLRRTQVEGAVSGAEYAARARERLARASGAGAGGDAPAWALAPSQLRRARARAGAAAGRAAGAAGGAGAAGDGGDGGADGEEEEEEEGDDDGDGGGDEPDGLAAALRSTAPLTRRSAALPAGALAIARVRDANAAEPARAVVQALAWHPAGAVLLTASLDARLRFFRVDGRRNARLATVFLPDLPVTSAAWTGDGAEVIATGRRPFFYVYDVAGGAAARTPRPLGRGDKSLEAAVVSPGPPSAGTAVIAFLAAGGTTVLAGARSRAWVANLKQDGDVRAAAFSRGPTAGGGGAGPLDFPDLLTAGTSGVVHVWDLRTLRCRGRHEDEGAAAGGVTALAAAPDGSRYAAGGASGVVNVYDAATALAVPPVVAAAAAAARAGGGGGGGGGGRGAPAPPPAPPPPPPPAPLFSRVAAPRPAWSLGHLTTRVSTLAWHPAGSGDVLLAASQARLDALRLAHGASGSVFSNWPTQRSPLHYVTAAAFSPGGGFLAVGNDRGRALLYRLAHYGGA